LFTWAFKKGLSFYCQNLYTEGSYETRPLFMPEEKPFFSILVHLLDRTSPLFSFTMDSILSQSFSSYEIIVLDGRKDKHTLDLFLLYAPFLTCSYPSLNENIFFMLNKGVSLAQGEYIHVCRQGSFICRGTLLLLFETS
jgi:hypothetical protein